MLKDLLTSAQTRQILQADAVVIGAGIAGLLLATRLARSGARTIVLESGAEKPDSDVHPLNAVVQSGQHYRGATVGRYRGLGGTSRRWGGAMLPFQPCDLGRHTAEWPVDWPLAFEEIDRYFNQIESIFELPGGAFDVELPSSQRPADNSFILRSAKWPSFRMRNVAHLFERQIKGEGVEIWLNATATRFKLAENGRLASVIATSPSGNELEVEAKLGVIAAGAIESTRLLLLLDAGQGGRVFGACRQLGRYFFDHLSNSAGTIVPRKLKALNETFGFRFVRSGMRDLRIEPSPKLRAMRALPGAFAHIGATSEADTGFAALRGIYRDLQDRSAINWRHALSLGRDVCWLSNAVWWRFVKGRLLYPRGARFDMMLVTEQMPNELSQITLSDSARDSLGVPLARIEWRTSAQDAAAFGVLQALLFEWWQRSPFAALGDFKLTPESCWRERYQHNSDIFHPGGTTRMGRSAASGVVDRDLKTFSIDNLYVVSTSTFPSGGCANPTFMLMALALRAADHIASVLRATPATEFPSAVSLR